MAICQTLDGWYAVSRIFSVNLIFEILRSYMLLILPSFLYFDRGRRSYPRASCVSLNGLILNSCSHTGSNWMIYHCCGSFQVSSKCLMLNIFCHSESSWMVYHQCGLFHVSSNGLILNIWSATRSKWMFFHWCELFHVSSMPDVKEWEQLNGVSPLWVLSCASSKSIHVFCLPCWKLNWHTGIKCCS